MDSRSIKVKLEDVTKRYGDVVAVDSLNLDIYEQECLVLLGPSGCGKTTTLEMINGLRTPSEGKVYIDGEDVSEKNQDQLRLNIGYAIQEVGLFPHMSVKENIGVVPEEKGWSEKEIENRAVELLEMVGMTPPETYKDRYPHELSGGQKQRVGVARALAANPSIMLMDEPFGALDPITRMVLQNKFLEILEKVKKTIAFVTHDMEEAIKIGDELAIMNEGKLVQKGSPRELVANPANDFIESLLETNKLYKHLDILTVGDLLLEDVQSLRADLSLKKAKKKMLEQDTGAIAVLQENRPPGMATLTDIERNMGKKQNLGDITKEGSFCLRMEENALEAMEKMKEKNISFAAVIDNRDRFRGVFDLKNLAKSLTE